MSKKLALSAIVKEASPQKIELHSNENFRSIRLLVFLLSSLVLLLTIAFVQASRTEIYDGIIILFIVLTLVIAFILLRPSDHRVHIDLAQNTVTQETEYRFKLPVISKVDSKVYPLSSFTEIKKEKNAYTDSYALILEAPGISRMRLNFANGKTPAKRVYRLLGLEEGPIEAIVRELPLGEDIEDGELEWDPVAAEVADMHKQLSSLARSLFILGLIHFFAPGVLDFSWGFILILVALGSALFRHPAMFVVHALTLAFIGFTNIFSTGLVGWALFGIFQIYLAYRTYKQFQQYQDAHVRYLQEAELDPINQAPYERTERYFPWLSVIFSSLGLSTYFLIILVVFVMAALNNGAAPMSDTLANIFSVQFNLGLLGLATGAAAISSAFPRKTLAWVGTGIGVLWLILDAILTFSA